MHDQRTKMKNNTSSGSESTFQYHPSYTFICKGNSNSSSKADTMKKYFSIMFLLDMLQHGLTICDDSSLVRCFRRWRITSNRDFQSYAADSIWTVISLTDKQEYTCRIESPLLIILPIRLLLENYRFDLCKGERHFPQALQALRFVFVGLYECHSVYQMVSRNTRTHLLVEDVRDGAYWNVRRPPKGQVCTVGHWAPHSIWLFTTIQRPVRYRGLDNKKDTFTHWCCQTYGLIRKEYKVFDIHGVEE